MVAEETSSENAFETTLTAEMGPTDLVAAVVTKGSLTSTSILTIEPDDDAQREIIRFNGVFGGSTFVTQNVSFRYLPGSAAPSGLTHPSGSIVRSTPTVQHLEDINDRVDTLDHGADLAGLGDDDHTQYHNDARGDARYVELAGDTMTGLLTLSGDPDAALKAATKQYVDALQPVTATVATSETTSSSSYTDLTTTGPAVTVTVTAAGVALVHITAEISNTIATNNYVGYAVSGATTTPPSDERNLRVAGAAATVQKMTAVYLASVNAGSNTFKLQYKTDGGTATFLRRSIIVTPY